MMLIFLYSSCLSQSVAAVFSIVMILSSFLLSVMIPLLVKCSAPQLGDPIMYLMMIATIRAAINKIVDLSIVYIIMEIIYGGTINNYLAIIYIQMLPENSVIMWLLVIAAIIITLVMYNKEKGQYQEQEGFRYTGFHQNGGFDLTTGLIQYPIFGRFHDKFEIGPVNAKNVEMCKEICNKVDTCKGISWGGRKPGLDTNGVTNILSSPNRNQCRLYNNSTRMIWDPTSISWRLFNDKIY